MDPIGSISGLASGIQWQDMIEQIMQGETARKLTPVQNQLAIQQKREGAWLSLSGLISKFDSAVTRLRTGDAFRAFTAKAGTSASGKSLFTATTSSSAAPGSYRVEVVKLATADKLNSQAFTSTTTALGLSGDFSLNGTQLSIATGDTLAAIRDRINAANSGATPTGVTASILTSSGVSRLILTADNTGSRGIELTDGDTGVLGSLGILNGSFSRNASTTDSTRTVSARVSSQTSSLKTVLGVSAPPAQTTISINGVKVQVDLTTDTLISVMNRAANAGADVKVEEETIGGKTYSRLSVAGDVTADPTATDPAASQRIVELLGFQTEGRANEITAGQDAVARIDGFRVTSRTNTVTGAIEGVTVNLLAANGAERTSSLSGAGLSLLMDPKTIDAGSYDIQLTASPTTRASSASSGSLSVVNYGTAADGTYDVSLTAVTSRSVTTDSPNLSVVAAPSSLAAGSYAVNVTTAASQATALGTAVSGTYTNTGDTITIADNVAGVTKTYTLTAGQTLDSVVAGLNTMLSGAGSQITATNNGGKLELQQASYGSTSAMTVTTNQNRVSTFFGIGSMAGTTYTGTDVAGTIGGQAATGSGQTLSRADGLQVKYTGTTTGSPVGTVSITDTTTITGGTIGGEAATWDAGTGQLTVGSGGSLAGLSVAYTGTPTSGSVGSVTLSTTAAAAITGVTIDGEAAVWDAATQTIRGAVGSRFDGLELGYSGPATSGTAGTLTVAGDIAADLTISRDIDSTTADVKAFVDAYNAVAKFVNDQRQDGAPLHANSTLRSILGSLKNPLLEDVAGLTTATSPYVNAALVGVTLDRNGVLQVDEDKLKGLLTTNLADVQRLFSTSGSASNSSLQYVAAGDTTKAGRYTVNVTQAAAQAGVTGTALGSGFTYTASNGVSDTLTITDAASGTTQDYVLTQGKSLDSIASELNSLFTNQGMHLTAAVNGTSLQLTSTDYGASSGFTLAGATATTGLGLTQGSWAGQDVAGTFTNADTGAVFTATGLGRVLTGDSGTDSAGLQVSYTGTATGNVGDLTFTLGLAGALSRSANTVTRAGDGIAASQTDSIDRSITSLNTRISAIQSRLEVQRQSMIAQFTRMEAAISKFQSQGSWLTSQIAQLGGGSH